MPSQSFYFSWEPEFIEWLQSTLGSGFGVIAEKFSLLGEIYVPLLVFLILYFCLDKDKGRTLCERLVAMLLYTSCIKNIAIRRRPYMDHDGISLLRKIDDSADIHDIAAQGYSFPSQHSATAVLEFGTLAELYGKKILKVLAIVLPLLVGFSRLYVGAHYPTDILAGWLFGALTILLLSVLKKAVRSEAMYYGILILAGLPGLFFCSSADYYIALGLMAGTFPAFLFEKRFVNFDSTLKLLPAIMRVLVGFVIFYALNILLKLPFSESFLEGGTRPALLVRALRYMVIAFVLMGVYPMLFRFFPFCERKKAAD